jgi:hypothetical protein
MHALDDHEKKGSESDDGSQPLARAGAALSVVGNRRRMEGLGTAMLGYICLFIMGTL